MTDKQEISARCIMTNELEETFFDTFGIKAHYKYLLIDKTSRCHNEKLFDKTNFIDFIKSGKDYLLLRVIKYYPQITDRILLELICILGNTSYFLITDDGLPIDVDGLKKSVLHSLTLQSKVYKNKVLKHQVRILFKEEN